MQSNSTQLSPRDDRSIATSTANERASSPRKESPRVSQSSDSGSSNSSPRGTKGKADPAGDKRTTSPQRESPLATTSSNSESTSPPRDKKNKAASVDDSRMASHGKESSLAAEISNPVSASHSSPRQNKAEAGSGVAARAASPKSPVPRLPPIPRDSSSPPLAPWKIKGPTVSVSDQSVVSSPGSAQVPRAPATPTPSSSRPSHPQNASPATPPTGDEALVARSQKTANVSAVLHTPKSSSVMSRYQPTSPNMDFGAGIGKRPARGPGPQFTPDLSPSKIQAAISTLSRLTLEPKPGNRMEIQAMIGHLESESLSVETDSRPRFANQTPSTAMQRKAEAKRKLSVLMDNKQRLIDAAACDSRDDFRRLMEPTIEELKIYFGVTS